MTETLGIFPQLSPKQQSVTSPKTFTEQGWRVHNTENIKGDFTIEVFIISWNCVTVVKKQLLCSLHYLPSPLHLQTHYQVQNIYSSHSYNKRLFPRILTSSPVAHYTDYKLHSHTYCRWELVSLFIIVDSMLN